MGQLVFQATAGGQVALVGPNPSGSFSINVPAVNSTLATLAAQTFAGTQTFSVDASISGLTVGKGGGSVGNNTVVGLNALANGSNTGTPIAAFGVSALAANTTGAQNAAFGPYTLLANTTGTNNTALGSQALVSNTTASNNTAVGYQAGYSQITGSGNVYLGQTAGYSNTGGANTFIGTASGYSMTSGNYNTILGSYSGNQGGLDIRTASNYIVLSDGAGNPRQIIDNNGYVGFGITAALANANGMFLRPSAGDSFINHATGTATGSGFLDFVYGGGVIGNITQNGTTGVLYNIVSDRRLKENIVDAPSALALIDSVKVRSFDFKSDGSHSEFGLIAQEFYEVAPECVKKGDDGEEITDTWGLDSSALVPALIKAIQELNAKVTALEAK